MRLSAAQLAEYQREGVLVVEGVCPPDVCADAVRAIEQFVAKDVPDESRWYQTPGLMYHGLVSNNQSQALWETRQQPALHAVFAQLLGTEALRVSGDASNFTPPASEAWASEQHIHWDMDSSQHILEPERTGLQGVLCLTDVLDHQGGFVCAPGFHHRLEAWAASVAPNRNDQIPTLADVATMDLRYIGAPAGSIIIWNSALPHSNSRNTADRPRVAQYITFSRAPQATGPSFSPAAVPLARNHFDVIASAIGVPAAGVSDWLHLHTQSDLVDVPCQSVEVMPMQDGVTPYWLRVRVEGREQPIDLHSQWSSIGTDGGYEDRRHWHDVAMPPLELAVKYLEGLNGDEKVVAAIEPPAAVWTPATRTAFGAAALLLGFQGWAKTLDGVGRGDASRDPSTELWQVLRRTIAENEDGWLVNRLMKFDKDNVSETILAQLQKFVDKEKQKERFLTKGAFLAEVAAKSRTAAALWVWVVAIDTYTKLFQLQAGDPIPKLSRTYHQLREWEQRSVPVQRPFLHHFDHLSPDEVASLRTEQYEQNAARRDASISLIPKHADFVGRKGVSEPRLSEAQIEQLAALLISEAPWRAEATDTGGNRVWTAEGVAELIGHSFGAELIDVVEAELSPLGRRLTGVDPWAASAAAGGAEGDAARL